MQHSPSLTKAFPINTQTVEFTPRSTNWHTQASMAHDGFMQRLVVKLTAGANNPELCSQAFTVAATAIAAGAEVSMWLTGDATWFAVPGRAEEFDLVDAAPLAGLRDLITSGGHLTVCTQCAKRRDLTAADLLPAVRIAGAATFVEESLAVGTQALVY